MFISWSNDGVMIAIESLFWTEGKDSHISWFLTEMDEDACSRRMLIFLSFLEVNFPEMKPGHPERQKTYCLDDSNRRGNNIDEGLHKTCKTWGTISNACFEILSIYYMTKTGCKSQENPAAKKCTMILIEGEMYWDWANGGGTICLWPDYLDNKGLKVMTFRLKCIHSTPYLTDIYITRVYASLASVRYMNFSHKLFFMFWFFSLHYKLQAHLWASPNKFMHRLNFTYIDLCQRWQDDRDF